MKHFVRFSPGFSPNLAGSTSAHPPRSVLTPVRSGSFHVHAGKKKTKKTQNDIYFKILPNCKPGIFRNYDLSSFMRAVSQLSVSLQMGTNWGGGFRDQLALALFYSSVFRVFLLLFFFFFLTVDMQLRPNTHMHLCLTHTE